jgi:hypothetical protein
LAVRGRSVALAVPFVIGLIFAIATIVTFAQAAIFVAGAVRTDATYAGSVSRAGGRSGGTFFYPQFRFTTDRGQAVTMTTRDGSTDQPYSDGETVSVLYDPAQPEQAKLDSFMVWIVPLCLAPFAFIFTLIPAGIFILGRRRGGLSSRSAMVS